MPGQSDIKAAWNRLDRHVKKFDEEYLKPGKIPRNHIWRPHRFCVQDVVLGLVAVRHSLELNCLLVDVCLITDAPEYELGSGARITTAFLFSEAYKCGGAMEIRFTENEMQGWIPLAILLLAYKLRVKLRHIEEGLISPSEAREFYLALTEFSPPLTEHIKVLANQGLLSIESVCYAVNHGIWSQTEVATIIFGSQRPQSIFAGQALAEQRHLYMHDVIHARAAILGGLLDKKLTKRERREGDTALELEDDVRRLDVQFDQDVYGALYRCDEPLQIPWIRGNHDTKFTLTTKETMLVLIRPLEVDEIDFRMELEIDLASRYAYSSPEPAGHVASILVPRDFDQLLAGRQEALIQLAEEKRIIILVCPETVFSLDAAASERLSRGRILRQ